MWFYFANFVNYLWLIMDFLWSPWRKSYIDKFKDQKLENNEECFFCKVLSNPEDEQANLLVTTKQSCIVMLNKYPYTSGHLLIAPKRHIANFKELTDPELIEIFQTIRQSTEILEQVLSPSGFNIGVNIGNVAGAGLPGHIHFHIVPRWTGDKNFMYVTGETNVISFSNEDIMRTIKPYFNE